MSVPIENEFYRVPGVNHTEVTRHIRIRDDQLYISTEGEFFIKGIKLVYDMDFPRHGTTTITFLTDHSIKLVWSDQVIFSKHEVNDGYTAWTAIISTGDIHHALETGENVHIDFTATGPHGRIDPQIRVTPF